MSTIKFVLLGEFEMITEPLRKLLDREESIDDAKEKIGKVSPLLKEVINYSTNVCGRCFITETPLKEEDKSIAFLYRHIIEFADAVEVLISNCCPMPAIPLVRSMYEALLTIQYILKENYKNRSLAWLYLYYHDLLEKHKIYDINSDEFKNFKKRSEREGMKNVLNELGNPEVKKYIKDISDKLNEEIFKDIAIEFNKYKNDKSEKSNSYGCSLFNFFGAKRKLFDLTIKLKRSVEYDTLYRLWCSYGHAFELLMYSQKESIEKGKIPKIRKSDELERNAGLAISFLLKATEMIFNHFREEDLNAFSIWYSSNVDQKLKSLTK